MATWAAGNDGIAGSFPLNSVAPFDWNKLQIVLESAAPAAFEGTSTGATIIDSCAGSRLQISHAT
jgi:hypothetical protein